MTVVDTSVLLALVDAADIHHAKAMERVAEGPIVVTRTDLAEVATVVRRRAAARGDPGNRVARVALRALLSRHNVREAAPPRLERIMALYEAHENLSFNDASTLATSLALAEPFVSFDRDLLRLHARLSKAS